MTKEPLFVPFRSLISHQMLILCPQMVLNLRAAFVPQCIMLSGSQLLIMFAEYPLFFPFFFNRERMILVSELLEHLPPEL